MRLWSVTTLDWMCYALLILGAINWGILGLLDINMIEAILNPIFQERAMRLVSRGIYVLIGLAGLYFLFPLYRFTDQTQNRSSTRW